MCIIDTSLSKLRRPRKSLIEMHHLNVAERRPRMLIQLQKVLGALGYWRHPSHLVSDLSARTNLAGS